MLSGILKNEAAVRTSIQIINAFAARRRFIAANVQAFHRLDAVERKQIEYKAETDHKFEQIFNAIEEQGGLYF